MLDINLIGNLVVDRVYKIRQFPVEGESNLNEGHSLRLGGLGNLLHSFALHKCKLQLGLQAAAADDDNLEFIKSELAKYEKRLPHLRCLLKKATQIPFNSEALILSDLGRSERTSLVRWGACLDLRGVRFRKAEWAQVSYLDLVENIDMRSLRKSADVLSADLCLSRLDKRKLAKFKARMSFLDFLFISSNETKPHYNASKDKRDFRNTVRRLIEETRFKGTLIYHSKASIGVFQAGGYTEELALPPPVRFLNTLGAGDWLCANFIRRHFGSGNALADIKGSCEYAYKTTTKDLISRGEEI